MFNIQSTEPNSGSHECMLVRYRMLYMNLNSCFLILFPSFLILVREAAKWITLWRTRPTIKAPSRPFLVNLSRKYMYNICIFENSLFRSYLITQTHFSPQIQCPSPLDILPYKVKRILLPIFFFPRYILQHSLDMTLLTSKPDSLPQQTL